MAFALLTLPPQLAVAGERPQLDVDSFARCLAGTQARVDLDLEKSSYRLGGLDLLLPYLALYAGKRIPWISDRAQGRWSDDFATEEEGLARKLSEFALRGRDTLVPSQVYDEALAACGNRSALCAALISHNVLRALGRPESAIRIDPVTHEPRDFNPAWYQADRTGWLSRAEAIQQALISLRRDGSGDRWGENYHFFGLFAFVVHEAAAFHEVSTARLVARMNQVLNPILVGEPEEPVKAKIDRQSVEVAARYVRGTEGSSPGQCVDRRAFVLAP